jgi:hypothetical protein
MKEKEEEGRIVTIAKCVQNYEKLKRLDCCFIQPFIETGKSVIQDICHERMLN